jgi:hypothetical protein
MTERDEKEKFLAEAAGDVSELYMGDRFDAALGIPAEARDEIWDEFAQQYSAFGEQIRALRTAVKTARAIKNFYTPQTLKTFQVSFKQVKDITAQELLNDLLLARMTRTEVSLDHTMLSHREADLMAKELGLKQGWQSQQATSLTPERVVSAVLQNKLRVTYQPPKLRR